MRRDDHGMSRAAVAAWQKKWGKGPFITADVAVFTRTAEGRLAVLLIERGNPPFKGRVAFPGGFVDEGEELIDAARRELEEETGVADVELRPLDTFGAPGRDPRGRTVTAAYLAVVPFDRVAHARGSDDAARAQFFPIERGSPRDDRGKRVRLAFDHDEMMRRSLEELRLLATFSNAPVLMMPKRFSLDELRALYEAILGRSLHARAFEKRVVDEEWVRERRSAFASSTRKLRFMQSWRER